MSKEPVERIVEQEQPEKGWHHGYTPEQIKLMEDAREKTAEGTPLVTAGRELADPDELEEELEEAEEEGDFKSTHRGRTGKAGRGK